MSAAPPIRKGWMKKLGRKGMIKNWKKRFFVLNAGLISYYEKESAEFPFGESLKGELNLANTEVIEENKNYNEKQIFIVSFNGEYNLLMEAETADDADDWIDSIKDHTKWSNDQADTNPNKNRMLKSQSMKVDNDRASTLSDGDSPSPAVASAVPAAASAPSATVTGRESSGSGSAPVASAAVSSSPAQSTSVPSTAAKSVNVSAPVSSHKVNAIAAAIDAEKIEFSTFCEKIPDYIQGQIARLQQDDSRNKWIAEITSNVQTMLTSLITNTRQGEFGTRGESHVGIVLVLSCSIIVGLHSILEMLIRFLIRLSGSLYVVIGVGLLISGLYELRGNANLFYLPIERNKLVTCGIFRMVRHPMYGGLMLLCIGLSITSQRWDKMVLSVALGVVLDQIATLEEGALLQEHPLAYRAFIGSRKKYIPFVV